LKKIVKCLNCGKEMELSPSKSRKYCSNRCYHEAKTKLTPMIEVTCEQCGKKFTRPKRSIKGQVPRFCSRKCKSDYWGRNRVVQVCTVCGKEFLTQKNIAGPNRCCSPECAAKNEHNPRLGPKKVKLVCEHCGKEFEKTQAYINKERRKKGSDYIPRFCSRTCFQESRNGYHATVKCEYCGKEYTVNGYRDRVTDKHFCSIKCRRSYEIDNHSVEAECKHCGKTFVTNRYHYEHVKDHYCSQDCRVADIRIKKDTYQKLQHYLRTSVQYDKWRKAVLERAEYKCEDCGAIGRLHAHHVVELYNIAKQYDFNAESILQSTEFNDVNNGICLCTDCHIKRHPYHQELRNQKGQFRRLEFKVTEETQDKEAGIKLEGEVVDPNQSPKANVSESDYLYNEQLEEMQCWILFS